MRVTETPRRNDYFATEGQQEFFYTWGIFDASHIQVLVDDQEIITGYSVSNVGVEGGGSVIFMVGRTAGEHVTLLGRQPYVQNSQYSVEAFPPKRIENDLSRQMIATQQLLEMISRAVTFNRMSTAAPMSLPLPTAVDTFLRALAIDPPTFDWATLTSQGNIAVPLAFANGGTGASYANADAAAQGLSLARWASVALTPAAGALTIPNPIAGSYFMIEAGNFASISAAGIATGTRILLVFTAGGNVLTDGAGMVLYGRTNYTTALGDASEFTYNGAAWVETLRIPLHVVGNATKFWRGDGTYQAIISTLRCGVAHGLRVSNSVGDPTNDIDIATGDAVSDDDDPASRVHMYLNAALTKQLDSEWAGGTNAGGRVAGQALADGTWHVFLFRRVSGVIDVCFSNVLTGFTVPDSGTKKWRIASIVRGGGAIIGFTQYPGGSFRYSAGILNANNLTIGNSRTTLALTVPTGIQVEAVIRYVFSGNASGSTMIATPISEVDAQPSVTAIPLATARTAGATSEGWSEQLIWTNTSGEIAVRAIVATNHLWLATMEYKDIAIFGF